MNQGTGTMHLPNQGKPASAATAKPQAEAAAAPKPEMTPLDITALPVFQQAVAAEVAKAMDAINAKLEALAQPAKSDDQSNLHLVQALAIEIAKISDPGNFKKRVSPEDQTRRDNARARLTDIILRVHAEGLRPMYVVKKEVYLGETLIRPIIKDSLSKKNVHQRVVWRLVPNESMEPANEIAQEIHAAFMESIGGASEIQSPRAVAKPHIPQRVPELIVLDEVGQDVVRPVAAPRMAVDVIRNRVPGEAVELPIHGTIAPPARQSV